MAKKRRDLDLSVHDIALRARRVSLYVCGDGGWEEARTYLLPCFDWAQYRCQAITNDETGGAAANLDQSSCDCDRIVSGRREMNGGDGADRFNVRYPSY